MCMSNFVELELASFIKDDFILCSTDTHAKQGFNLLIDRLYGQAFVS